MMRTPEDFTRELDRLTELLRAASDRAEIGCGVDGATEVDGPERAGGTAAPAPLVTSFHKEGCERSLLVRAFEREFTVELQTVPQSETHAIQAQRETGAWIWNGRSYGTEQLAGEILRVWRRPAD